MFKTKTIDDNKKRISTELCYLFILLPGECFDAGELVRVPHGDQRVGAARGKVLATLGELDTDAVAGMGLTMEKVYSGVAMVPARRLEC